MSEISGIRLFLLTRRGRFCLYLVLALCGAAYTLAFPGIGWNLLAWIGMIPPVLAVCRKNPRRSFLKGFVWGFFWNLTMFMWLREIELFLPVVMAVTLALFCGAWSWFTAMLCKNLAYSVETRLKGAGEMAAEIPFRRIPSGILFLFGSAGAWCVLEWVRSWILTGLPWNLLASSQWQVLPLIQVCEYTGMYGISFLVVFVNLALAMTILRGKIPPEGARILRFYPLALALFLLVFYVCAGMFLWRREVSKPKGRTFHAGLVQCDLSQRRFPKGGEEFEALDVCVNLSRKILSEQSGQIPVSFGGKTGDFNRVSLIIWPETAVPYPYRSNAAFSEIYRREVGKLLDRYQIPFLIGSTDFCSLQNGETGFTNSALLLEQSGGTFAAKYDKIHLVPFGEYVPFAGTFPRIERALGMGRSLTAGTRFNPLPVSPGVRAGVMICYESVFPEIARGHALAGANLLLVMANDAWYPTSNEPEQHFANAVFRTVETRLPLLRSGNSSHTAWIDSCGVIRKTATPDRSEHARKAAVFSLKVPEEAPLTFYARFGNVFIILCGILAAWALIIAFLNWRTYRLAQIQTEGDPS